VRQKREELGIPNAAGNRWRDDEIALLGTLPDREVARRLGRSLQSVTRKRIKLGIANRIDGRKGDRSVSARRNTSNDGVQSGSSLLLRAAQQPDQSVRAERRERRRYYVKPQPWNTICFWYPVRPY
jgi:hypothetical protein